MDNFHRPWNRRHCYQKRKTTLHVFINPLAIEFETISLILACSQALCYSHARASQHGLVLRRTKHVIFLDTPHAGLNPDAWRAISRGTFGEESIGQWKLWSSVLTDLRKIFSEIASGFNVTSACASLRSSNTSLGDEVTPGDSGLTCLSHERILHLDGVRHLTISKFTDSESPNYRRLLDRIRAGWTYITNDPDQISRVWSWIGVQAGADGQLLSSHSMTWNIDDHESALQSRHPKTLSWLHDERNFQRWASRSDVGADNPKVLWLNGPEGAGKSVVCSYAIETISTQSPRPATPYLYLKLGMERNKCQMAQILASQLLGHVLREQGGVEVEVLSLVKHNSLVTQNLQDLIRLLVTQCSSVYFFVDGLNEIALPRAAPSEGRKGELDRLTNNLKSTIDFLAKMTNDETTHVRLWCSSQNTQPVLDWMQELRATELNLDTASVHSDVLTYLADVNKEAAERLTEQSDRDVVEVCLMAQAGANFRWAYMMKESINNCTVPKLLVQKVAQGLPRDLRTSYKHRLEELQALDLRDVEDGNPPLSMNILSILAHTRRPLTLQELQEALSIIDASWSKDVRACQDLESDILIQRKDIIHRCKPLVKFVQSTAGDIDHGYLSLSHASVFKFLHETSNEHQEQEVDSSGTASTRDEKTNSRVDDHLIASACLKYLSQKRYSRPLRKVSTTDFETGISPSSNVRQHFFLQYAAKYWYRHFEASGSCTSRCAVVKNFLTSPQFITAIQTQSLFVVGHFINSFDEDEGVGAGAPKYGRVMKRNIPEWFRRCDEGRELVADYEVFISEWSRFLQMGVTDCMNGEIERCLWGALGETNFLWNYGREVERNKSYVLGHRSVSAADRGRHCSYETISKDGKRISVWGLSTFETQNDDTKSPSSRVSLTRDMWYIDGLRSPFQYGPQEKITFDPSTTGWDLYDHCRSRNFPLVPNAGSLLARAPPVADCLHGLNVRIGAIEFLRERRSGEWIPEKRRTTAQEERPVRQKPSTPYWDDIIIQGPFKARSRRVLFVDEFPDIRELGPRESSRDDDSDHSDSSAQISSDEDTLQILSGAEECWIFGSSGSSAMYSDDEEDESSEAERFGLGESSSGQEERSSDSDSKSESEESRASRQIPSSASSASSQGNKMSPSDSDADDEAASESQSSSESDSVPYQPGIGRPSVLITCNVCDTVIVRSRARRDWNKIFYACALCVDGNYYDICTDCFNKDNWCKATDHQLRRMVYRGGKRVTLDILSRNRAEMVISILVSRMNDTSMDNGGNHDVGQSEVDVFRYTSRSRDPQASLLHASGPIIHPTLPLLVYPLDGRTLLFGDLNRNTYLTHTVPYDETEKAHQQRDGKAHPVTTVSIDMHFSPCGRYLHMARTTSARRSGNLARPLKHKYAGRLRKDEAGKTATTARLFMQTITIRLSKSNPCSGLPRTLKARRGVSLGRWQAAAVRLLPTRLTWTAQYLYVSMATASSMLTVFRIPLMALDDTAGNADEVDIENGEGEEIMTLTNPIPLPRSARNRPVYFYPAIADDAQSCARIILGSVHGSGAGIERSQPPAVVYLRPQPEEEKWEWKPASEGLLSSFSDLKTGSLRMRTSDTLLEDFDADSDCDLIMPLLDFQR